jgi:RNA polymerase sigma-70 factor (ECF subfamily)
MNATDQFEVIVREHYEPLFRFAMSLARAESDARDLTQQTFYIWATKGHQLRDISKIKTWLFTTLHRAFLVARRRQSRFANDDLEAVSDQLPALCPELADHVDSLQVLSVLARVDEVHRGAVALFYLEDCSYKDIAAILEVPVGTVKSRIARGLAQLRELLLSDGSGASTPRQDGISSIPAPDKPAASLQNIPPGPDPQRLLPTRVSGRGYDEWDFNTTRGAGNRTTVYEL